MPGFRRVGSIVLALLGLALLPELSYAAPLTGKAHAEQAEETTIERMIQEAPDFSAFPKADGIVWLKDLRYSMAADGSMTRMSRFVIPRGGGYFFLPGKRLLEFLSELI